MSQTNENIKLKQNESIAKNMVGYFAERKNRAFAVIAAIVFGVIFTVLVTEHRIGINYFLVVLLAVAVFGYIMNKDGSISSGRYAFWSAILLMYASVFFRLQNEVYTAVTILFMPILLVILTIFSAKSKPKYLIANGIIRLVGSIAFVDKIFVAIKSLMGNEEGKSKKQLAKILIGVGISLVLLLMIVPLMFSADAAFESFIVDFINLTEISKILWKSVLSAIIAVLFFGFLYIITVKKNAPEKPVLSHDRKYDADTVLITVLSVVGAIYTLFAAVQFTYLFGGLKSGLPDGVSITEYARSGYFEQVFMTVINLALIGISILLTEKSLGKTKTAINIMLVYFIAINFYLLISSAYKMGIYQSAYGFTVLRLLVDVLIIFEASVFVLLLYKVFKRSARFLICLIYFTAAFWAVVSFINIEGLSADMNIKRFESGEEIDIAYMCLLRDVSGQLNAIYSNYYNMLDKGEIEAIENYFSNDNRTEIDESGDVMLISRKPIEYNISASKWINDAKEILEAKNNR